MITEDQALETTRWDLEPLLAGATVEGLLEEALERARAFSAEHRGKVAELDAGGLAAAMRELEAIGDRIGRAGSYSQLWFSLDTEDPRRGALLQATRERGAAIETELLFFELEWNELPDEPAARLLDDEQLGFCRHYLRTLRRYRPHQLSEPEERILTELEVTGSSAFRRLFTEQVSSLRV
jgi:oligoendopeptidase F